MTEVREIKFEDIRKGDIIRTVRTFEDGFILTLEGEATHLKSHYDGSLSWRHKNSTHGCAADNYGSKADDKFYLVHREEKADHVVGYDDGVGGFKVETFCTLTEAKAKETAACWTTGGTRGRIYRAVKVEL